MNNNNGQEVPDPPKANQSGRFNNGNGRDLINYRLNELERRMNAVEGKLDKINDTCKKIDTKMDSMASKAFVLTYYGVTLATLIATFIGHIILRSIGT